MFRYFSISSSFVSGIWEWLGQVVLAGQPEAGAETGGRGLLSSC